MPLLKRPLYPIPPPLRGAEAGSFAHYTVTRRMPGIARRVIDENDFPPANVTRLEALIAELPEGFIRPLTDTDAPDAADWQRYVAPYKGQEWLHVPWFFGETYFYRRILEATGYFEPGPGRGVDPFTYQKVEGLNQSWARIGQLSAQVNEALADQGWEYEVFADLLAVDLWGNQADLSVWPAGQEGQPSHLDAEAQQAHLLVNDTAAIFDYLSGLRREKTRVDFISDNAGFELVGDFCLADYLLGSEAAAAVHFHLKTHPTFVSDATIKDVDETIAALVLDGEAAAQALGQRVQAHLDSGRLQLQKHPFWTSPLPLWQMPDGLYAEMGRPELVISKGDANYRRALADSHWAHTTPFSGIVSYFPAPIVCLRTLKSEVVAGLQIGQPEALVRRDPDWLTDGNWGVIQSALQKRSRQYAGESTL